MNVEPASTVGKRKFESGCDSGGGERGSISRWEACVFRSEQLDGVSARPVGDTCWESERVDRSSEREAEFSRKLFDEGSVLCPV